MVRRDILVTLLLFVATGVVHDVSVGEMIVGVVGGGGI